MRCCPRCKTTYPPDILICPKDGGEISGQLDPYLGKIAGSYRIIELLGEGGMGFVYRAEHLSLQKKAAIKLIRPELAQRRDIAERFLAEAQIISQLNHEHIVGIMDVGMLDGELPYFVMEFLEGESLSKLLEQRARLSPSQTIALLTQLLEALSVAHQRGIIHRDLKPENVFLLQRKGQPFVKLLDFGIAKFLDPQLEVQTQTRNGSLLGTPQYMSPEQIQARSQEIDGRSDLYSVGVLLFECLSGRLPFEGGSFADYVIAHVMKEPPPVTQIATEVSPALSAVVQKALQKKREDRYQSAAEMSAALQEAGGARATPEAPAESPTLWYIAGASVLIFLLMVGVLVYPSAEPPPSAPPLAVASAPTTQPTSAASAPMIPAKITLAFDSSPSGATVLVSIDGEEKNLGATPTRLQVARDSKLSVQFTKGNLRAQRQVVATQDQSIVVKLTAPTEPRKNTKKDPGNGTIPFGGKR